MIMNKYTGLEIAVIGMSGKFPGANNLDEYWDNLSNGREAIEFFSDEELIESGIKKELIASGNYVKAGGCLHGKENFDSSFFNYSPGEATSMDPQIRVFHEVVYSALEDAGCIPENCKGPVALFTGAGQNAPWVANTNLNNKLFTVDAFTKNLLNNKDHLSTLISYKLNLTGAAISIHTACSTSLVAIHLACRNLLMGESKVAIAGGVSITNMLKSGYVYKKDMIYSPDGHCRPFDAKSAGTLLTDGVGVVVLKKLQDAINDRDNIHAIIKGSAINNDGVSKVGYTAPSVKGQLECIKTAQKMSKVEPKTISYVEAHGTGTKLGDPIEIEALNIAFNNEKNKHCFLGSVKSNIGHTGEAAGIAGFIKTVLCIKNRQIPATLHFENPNENIEFDNGPFIVNTKLREWKNSEFPLRAGVSSLGVGGTNAHVILEEPPKIDNTFVESNNPQILVLSAKSPGALRQHEEKLLGFLLNNIDANIKDIAWTLQEGRKAFPYRSCVTAFNVKEAINQLSDKNSNSIQSEPVSAGGKKLAFMFTGQGSQYVNMGRELYENEEPFRSIMDNSFQVAMKFNGKDYKKILYPENENNEHLINETANAQPILFMFEYALAKQLEHFSIVPDLMIGHSIGEYTAACLSGVMSFEDTLKLVIKRGELMQGLPKGSMLSVGASQEELKSRLSSKLSIAAVNSDSNCVLSGEKEDLELVYQKLVEDEIPAKFLHTSHAFHSEMMAPIKGEFSRIVSTVELKKPSIPYFSNVTGEQIKHSDLTEMDYWSSHLTDTVLFSSGIQKMLESDDLIFVEIGPGNTLSNLVYQNCSGDVQNEVVSLVRHPKIVVQDQHFLYKSIGKLWTSGCELDWSKVSDSAMSRKISLPTYHFESVKFPLAEDVFSKITSGSYAYGDIERREALNWFYEPSWTRSSISAKNHEQHVDGHVLIFMDDAGIGHEFAKTINCNSENIIQVKIGDQYRMLGDNSFQLNPGMKEDYEALFKEIKERGVHLSNIIHLFTLNTNKDEADCFEKLKTLGYYSLLNISKNIPISLDLKLTKLLVVSNDIQNVSGVERSQLSKSLMLGLVNVISQESPQVECKCVDISLDHDIKTLVKNICGEMHGGNQEKNIAYRFGKRWVRNYNQLELDLTKGTGNSKLKQNGVYLITGGLGSLGFLYSMYLLENYNASLILVGRSENLFENNSSSNDVKSQRLNELKQAGNVLFLKSDVASFDEMNSAVRDGESAFGKINGIIHTAGVTRGGSFRSIGLLKEEECENQFSSKVYGLLVLEKLFRNVDLDFCLLSSSLSSVLGGKEFGAYSSANIFMDYFSDSDSIKNCVSINFDGLNFEDDGVTGLSLNRDEMIVVLENALSLDGIRQVIISVGDLKRRLDKWVYGINKEIFNVQDSSGTFKEELISSNLNARFTEPKTSVEKQLCILFETFLGTARIGINDDLFLLGTDSLKAMTLINHIHREFGVEISLSDFFQYHTIHELAIIVENRMWLNNANESDDKIII